ncbi:MAG: 50S ribosomal protein L23 [Spirochaetaceae bacterium]|nr:MAG: 50S ribosomal protein L23 [Spirochaetaceae bacterium]
MEAMKVILAPVVTEKSNHLKDQKKYVFRIDPAANKFQVKKALKELFNVHCSDCRIINVKAKPKRVRYKKGLTATWKKAVVTLAAGETIAIFEGA